MACAIPLHCEQFQKLVRQRAIGWVHGSVDSPRLNVVYRDTTRAEFPSKPTCQAGNRPFRHGVDGAASEGHEVARGAADIDYPSALSHVSNRLLNCNKKPPYIDSDHVIQFLEGIV